MKTLIKYPRTPHIEGSGLQKGDEDLNIIKSGHLKEKHLVIEEKIDGANCGISFDKNGALFLQSRGYFLTGGYRERHFNLLKTWAGIYSQPLFEVLEDRFIMYGEWMYAKHTVYYDLLPHYFMEKEDIQKELYRASLEVNLYHLSILARSDIKGRKCADKQRMLDCIELFVEAAIEYQCINKPATFLSNQSKVMYFKFGNQYLHYDPYDTKGSKVILLSGLPAVGKDTYVREHLSNYPMISLDEMIGSSKSVGG